MTGEAFDLIQVGCPVSEASPLDVAAVRLCAACVRARNEPGGTLPLIDRRRVNPDADLWALAGDGLLVSDRVRALLSICCPDQVQFVPVGDCAAAETVIPGFFVARPLSELRAEGPPVGEVRCDGCGASIPLHRELPAARASWDGADLVAAPLQPGPLRRYLASRRLLLLLQKAGARGTRRFHDPLLLAGEGPVHELPEDWAEKACAAIPTERTFRAAPPDEQWLEAYLERTGAGHTGVHPRALMAWQHGHGIPLPPSFRSALFCRDGFALELTGRTRSGRTGLTGRVEVASLARVGRPGLRLGSWEAPAEDEADRRWDGLAFASMADGTLWAFDLSRPTNRGEYPVFRYDPALRRPVEFFDHFVDWLQELA